MSTEFISFLAAPGDKITGYTRSKSADDESNDDIPSTFVEAMSVREEVFVDEQHVPAENELDYDDARSFHWVVYASVSSTSKPGARKGSETTRSPVGTVRLVPPPHPPHPTPGSQHKIDNAEDGHTEIWYAGKEPYVKLGRLATLKPYRGLGLGRLLVNAALEWAGQNSEVILPPLSPTSREQAKADGAPIAEGKWKGLVLVHAQKDVEAMWKKYGFAKDESMGTWIEEGIEHVGMWKRIPVTEQVKKLR
ncbi:MAG: hypothetical protein M1833_005517 [Piccolia ochrophora]|nr:MAG: hypothetical protein M1833_005517 [Piccolia ochrophora]